MLELIVLGAAVVAMVKIADTENRSPWIWGGVTLFVCVLSLTLPWPLLRIGIAFVIVFVLMTVVKIMQDD